MPRFQDDSDPYCYRFISIGERIIERKHLFFDMTDATEGAETGGKGRDLTDILTDGFMESFVPGLENLQGRLGELT